MIIVNPTTPGQRGLVKLDNSQLTTKKPVKALLRPRKQKSGRNNQGPNHCSPPRWRCQEKVEINQLVSSRRVRGSSFGD